MTDVALEVLGELWTGWTSLIVSHSLSAAAGTVALSGSAIPERGLTGREPVRVLTDGIPVFTGHLDQVEVRVDGENRSFSASGRSLTGDLVDSAVDPYLSFGEEQDVSIRTLAFRYATEGANVRVATRLGEFAPRVASFAPIPGETYFDAIERACRVLGLLVTTNGDGDLVIVDPALFQRGTYPIQEGRNVLAMSASTSWRERFHSIVVQGTGPTESDAWSEDLRVLEEARDLAIRPVRVGVVNLEGAATRDAAKKRAQWEVAVRAARGSRVRVTVEGWRQGLAGDPWAPGIRVPVSVDSVGVDETLVLDSVDLTYSDDGELANLSFARQDAYRLEEELQVENDPAAELLGWSGA